MVQLNTTNMPMELPCMPAESSFQLEHTNTKQSIVLQDAHIPQEAKVGPSSLLQEEYNSIISKSPTHVGRTNLFQMDIPTTGLPIAHKPYPILLKYQDFVSEEMRLLEKAGCTSKNLSLWATLVIIVPKCQTP